MTNKTTTLRPLLVVGLDRRVRHPPELPDENRRECLIDAEIRGGEAVPLD